MMKKWLALTLTVTLLCLGVFCLNTAATEAADPTVSIEKHTLTLKDSIWLVYFVDTQNLPAGAETGVLVWNAPQSSYTLDSDKIIARLTSLGKQNVNGVYYDRFELKGIAARDMATDYYAVAYVKMGDEVIYSTLDTYSVVTYAHTQLAAIEGNDAYANLRKLIVNMLDYGAMAQIHFTHNTDNLANAQYSNLTGAIKPSVTPGGVTAEPLVAEGNKPAVGIQKHTLTLKDSIWLVYFVESLNVPTGAESGVLVWDGPQDSYTLDSATATKLTSLGKQDVNGTYYDRYELKGIAARDMATDYYAVAYVKDGDTVTYSKVDKYSVLQYAQSQLTAIAGNAAYVNLENLITGMLNYGASAQTHFEHNTGRLATDTYYPITIIGGTLSDGTTGGLYKNGDWFTMIAPPYDTYGEPFFCWLNSKGTQVAHVPTCQYSVNGAQTYTIVYRWDRTADTSWYNADHTTFTLYNTRQLAGLAQLVNEGNTFAGKTIKLGKDLDLNSQAYGYTWTPIGKDSTNSFAGTFDGQGHTIYQMLLSSPGESRTCIGLFGCNNGTVKNLVLEKTRVSYYEAEYLFYTGFLAGYNTGTVENVTVRGTQTNTHSLAGGYLGGLVGYNGSTGKIINCSAENDVNSSSARIFGTTNTFTYYVGGLVAYNNAGQIRNSYSMGNVSHSGFGNAYAGGLVAYNDNGTIDSCYATRCNVSLRVTQTENGVDCYAYAGGLVGCNRNGAITKCYALGDVENRAIQSSTGTPGHVSVYAGGLVGDNSGGVVMNSYATGDVAATHLTGGTSSTYVGGLAGANAGGLISNSYRADNQSISDSIGGMLTGSANVDGTEIATHTLLTPAFHTNTLGWGADLWQFVSGGYPRFKKESDVFVTITVKGGILPVDGATAGLYKPGEEVTIQADSLNAYYKPFGYWKDSNGTMVSELHSYIYTFTAGTKDETFWAIYDGIGGNATPGAGAINMQAAVYLMSSDTSKGRVHDATDNTYDSFWQPHSNDNGTFWVQYEFEQPVTFNSFFWIEAEVTKNRLATVKLESSNDGVSWTTVCPQTSTSGLTASPTGVTDMLRYNVTTAETTARFVRVTYTSTASSAHIKISEHWLSYQEPAPEVPDQLTKVEFGQDWSVAGSGDPGMTFYADTQGKAHGGLEKAFDNNTATRFASAGQGKAPAAKADGYWFVIDFGKEVTFDYILDVDYNQAWVKWDFYTSADKTSWTLVDQDDFGMITTPVTTAANTVNVEFVFDKPITTRYLKIAVTNTGAGLAANSTFSIWELSFFKSAGSGNNTVRPEDLSQYKNSMKLDSLYGKLTVEEVKSFTGYVEANFTPATNNWEKTNAMIYGATGGTLEVLNLVYKQSGYTRMLPVMCKIADTMLYARNDQPGGEGVEYCMGGVQPAWVNQQGSDFIGVEIGDIAGHILFVAENILNTPAIWDVEVPDGDPYGYGKTYKARAVKYVELCDQTLRDYLMKYFINDDYRAFEDSAITKANTNMTDHFYAWNRQFMMVGGFVHGAKCHRILKDNDALADEYDKVVQALVDFFVSQLRTTTVNGEECYVWNYWPAVSNYQNSQGETFSQTGGKIEDANDAHMAYDVYGMYICHLYGYDTVTDEVMQRFCNTLNNVVYDPDNAGGVFRGSVNGTTGKADKDYVWPQVITLGIYDEESYEILFGAAGSAMASNLEKNIERFGRVLYTKSLLYGITPEVEALQ